MSPDDSRIKARLDETLNSIFCPVFGCWPLTGEPQYLLCHTQIGSFSNTSVQLVDRRSNAAIRERFFTSRWWILQAAS
jgi:hypothetical protein